MSRKKIDKNIAWDDERELYYVTLYFGKQSDGRTIKKTVTATSKKEAQKKLREHNKKMEAGTAVAPSKVTVSAYTENFISYKSLSLSETTIYGYTNILKNHLAPYFGKKNLQDVTTQDVQDYVTVKAKSGISLQSIKKHVALLYSVFQNAYINKILNENPVDRMERIKAPSTQMECMNAAEIAVLCASVKDTQLEIPVKLAAYLGLRRGEVLGLKWEHIDFGSATLTVNNTRTKAGKNVIEKQPKTERSIRQLAIGSDLLDLLLYHKKRQADICKKNCIPQEYVVTMDSGKPFSPNYLSECFHSHLIQHKFKLVRFHDLRHSFASIANDAGTSMNDISDAMGHSNISTTSGIYTHAFDKKKTKAVNAVALSIENAKTADNSYVNIAP